MELRTSLELNELVEADRENHAIKHLAQLFLNAMNDWPTSNQIDITEFVKELKDDYGPPLSSGHIKSQQLDIKKDGNSWRLESGSSIIEMIEFSNMKFGETDFDKILFKIIKHYSNRASR
jgi:hypothetical protein